MDLIHKSDDCLCCSCVHFDRVKARAGKDPTRRGAVRVPCVPRRAFEMFKEVSPQPEGYFYTDLRFEIVEVFFQGYMKRPRPALLHDCDKRSVVECFAYERKE